MKKQAKQWLVQVSIKQYDLFCLVVSAIEGGSNYWVSDFDTAIDGITPLKRTTKTGSSIERFYNDMVLHGFTIPTFHPDTGKKRIFKVTPRKIQKALSLMASGNPHMRHFEAMIGDSADQETADVFMQLCVFGDVIYG